MDITRGSIAQSLAVEFAPEVNGMTDAQLERYQGLIGRYIAGVWASDAGWYAD